MSKTRKGSKGGGFEYWSRRPYSGIDYGSDIKKRCKRIERRRARIALRKGKDLPNKEGIGGR